MFKVEAPEITWVEIEDYPRILAAAREEGEAWHVATRLAAEAGLRIGEIRALDWQRDVDLIAGTLTVNHQIRHGQLGPPKGRTRRTIPMTASLRQVLRKLEVLRRGFVARSSDGSGMTDGQTMHAIRRIRDHSGVPLRGWHVLRHSFGTHAALFGVNAWRLQAWLGHKRIEQTMGYVHVAEAHGRTIPPSILAAGAGEQDPERRVLAMLGARGEGADETWREEVRRSVNPSG